MGRCELCGDDIENDENATICDNCYRQYLEELNYYAYLERKKELKEEINNQWRNEAR